MSILKDIMDTLKDIDIHGSAEQLVKSKRYSSISDRANEGVLNFAVLTTRSTDIKTAQMISKSLERKYASFVMISTTLAPTFVVKSDKVDLTDYLRRFHQNMNGKYSSQSLMNDLVTLARENSEAIEGDNAGLLFTLCEGATPKIVQSNKEGFESIVDSLKLDILNEKYVPSTKYRTKQGILEANNPAGKIVVNPVINIDQPKSSSSSRKRTETVSDKILRDNDVKKANELVPTTLHLKVTPVTTSGQSMEQVDFLIGIKATLHGIDSDDMITNMISACRHKGKLFNFIKWTTGEISFAKDLILNINSIKEDIARRSAGSSPWWLALKRRRRLAKIKNKLLLPSGMLPNATIVITMEEANIIKQEYGFDLLNPVFVDKIMEEYFLLGFVIVDAPAEMAHFMFDGQKEFEIVTFDGLERENSNNKGIDAKDVVKIMNRL